MIILTILIGRPWYIDSKNKDTHLHGNCLQRFKTREKKNHVFVFKKLFRLSASCEPQLPEELYIIKNAKLNCEFF
jgi:hypothetical protein